MGIFDWIWDLIKGAVNSVKDWVLDKINGIKRWVSGLIDGVKSFAKGLFESAKRFAENLVKGVKSWVNGLIDTVKSWVRNLIDGVKNYARNLINGVRKTLERSISGVRSFAKSLASSVKKFTQNLFSGLKKKFDFLRSEFYNFLKGSHKQFSEFVNLIWSKIVTPLSNFLVIMFNQAYQYIINNIREMQKYMMVNLIDFIATAYIEDYNLYLKQMGLKPIDREKFRRYLEKKMEEYFR